MGLVRIHSSDLLIVWCPTVFYCDVALFSADYSAIKRKENGQEVVVPMGRPERFPEHVREGVIEAVKEAGYSADSFTLDTFTELLQEKEKDIARKRNQNPFAKNIDVAAAHVFVQNHLKLNKPVSAQTKRRVQALSDHRNSVAAAVMERVLLFDDPLEMTGELPPNRVFNMDATSIRLSSNGAQKNPRCFTY